MKKLVLASLVLSMSLYAIPENMIKSEINKKIEISAKAILDKSMLREQKINIIKKEFEEVFDYPLMARITLGRAWRKFSKEQQQEFAKTFKIFLEGSYADKIGLYEGQEVKIQEFNKIKSTRGILKLELQTKDKPFTIEYKMHSKKGQDDWKVYDLILEGISLVQTYKKNYSGFLKTNSIDMLIEELKKKNRENQNTK